MYIERQRNHQNSRERGKIMGKQFLKYRKRMVRAFSEYYEIYLLLIPIMLYYLLFCYLPMNGLKMAFQDYVPVLGLDRIPWVGFKHF